MFCLLFVQCLKTTSIALQSVTFLNLEVIFLHCQQEGDVALCQRFCLTYTAVVTLKALCCPECRLRRHKGDTCVDATHRVKEWKTRKRQTAVIDLLGWLFSHPDLLWSVIRIVSIQADYFYKAGGFVEYMVINSNEPCHVFQGEFKYIGVQNIGRYFVYVCVLRP